MESLKPGDKVRLKKLQDWVVTQEAAMTIKHVGEYSSLGLARGVCCEWINARGRALIKVYAMEDVIPI
jgi:hypothetical protein